MKKSKKDNQLFPPGYKIPDSSSGYMRLEQGDNKFRILSKPVVGNEYWKTDSEGNRKPIRKRNGEKIQVSDIEPGESIKHFWAMVVWNYDAKALQILEITQKSILKDIYSYAKSEDWGDFRQYDIIITREGEMLKTTYSVKALPPRDLEQGIVDAYRASNINLEALFDGEDPFADNEYSGTDIEEIIDNFDKDD